MAAPDITSQTESLVATQLGNAPTVRVQGDSINGSPGASQLVNQGWSDAHAFATNAVNAAQAFLANLNGLAIQLSNLPFVDTNLESLNLSISQFDYLLASAPPTVGNNFAFQDTVYSSSLLTDLRAQLLAWVDGTTYTGLSPAVEQAIWDRARNREAVNVSKKSAEAIRSFATRGFTKPPGALSTEIQEAVQAGIDANSTFSRDVAIKQADLEQSNRRFSFEQAWKVEEGSIQYTKDQMQRALESAKVLQGYYIDIYREDVTKFGAQVQEYGTRVNAEVSVFKAIVDENVAEANIRVETVKANIQRLIQQVTLTLETIKAGAQVSSQLAASALSSVNLSGGIHSSVSFGASVSQSSSSNASASMGLTESQNFNQST